MTPGTGQWFRITAGACWLGGLVLFLFAAAAIETEGSDWMTVVSTSALGAGFGAIGWLLTVRRPRHPVGWLLLGTGSAFALRLGVEEWVARTHASQPGFDGRPGVLLINLLLALMSVPLIVLMAMYPHDRMPEAPWRKPLYGAFGLVAIGGLLAAPIASYEPSPGVVLPPPVAGYEELAEGLGFLTFLPLAIMLLVLPVRLLILLFRGDRVERLQIRWLAWALLLVGGLLVLTPWLANANEVAGLVAGFAIPAAIWIAITRHGLYEIDRIISRTVTFTIVAGGLALIFAAGAVWLPQLLPAADSKLAVAGSTLAVAALFNPLRRRVQRLVERRFHRLPYVVDEVVDALADRLRNAVEPRLVIGAFAEEAAVALSPASIGVWTKPAVTMPERFSDRTQTWSS